MKGGVQEMGKQSNLKLNDGARIAVTGGGPSVPFLVISCSVWL
jgi:hypothetical protein